MAYKRQKVVVTVHNNEYHEPLKRFRVGGFLLVVCEENVF